MDIRGYYDRGKIVANLGCQFIGQFVQSWRDGNGVKELDGGYHYFSQSKPGAKSINNKSIIESHPQT